MAPRTYFDLIKDCLVEMFYEEPTTWEETNTTEGNKVKRLLNQALETICLGENIPWKFRERMAHIILVEDVREYPMVPGYIHSIRYHDEPIQLYYDERYIDLPMNAKGMPTLYWVYGNKINLYPIANKQQQGEQLDVRFLTNYCAMDCCGVLKRRMEAPDDEPIIPEEFRDILIYKVCGDFRRSATDSASVYYREKYRWAYKSLLEAQKLSNDYPNGFDLGIYNPTLQESIMNVFYNPRVYSVSTQQYGRAI